MNRFVILLMICVFFLASCTKNDKVKDEEKVLTTKEGVVIPFSADTIQIEDLTVYKLASSSNNQFNVKVRLFSKNQDIEIKYIYLTVYVDDIDNDLTVYANGEIDCWFTCESDEYYYGFHMYNPLRYDGSESELQSNIKLKSIFIKLREPLGVFGIENILYDYTTDEYSIVDESYIKEHQWIIGGS